MAVYGIPYLEPDALVRRWDLPARSHQAALAHAMRPVRADLANRPGARSVVLAHAFVAGGVASDSERDISVGGISVVPLDLFAGIDYTALGHLHGRATLTDAVRYSGSPLAYSFSEATHRKGSWLVDLGANGAVTAEFVDAPVPRPLDRLQGTLDEPADRHRARAGREVLGRGDPDRRRPPRCGDGTAARAVPARRVAAVRARARRAGCRSGCPPRAGRPTTIALDFVDHVRGGPATACRVGAAARRLGVLPGGRDLLPVISLAIGEASSDAGVP